jgi:hypothetical protein
MASDGSIVLGLSQGIPLDEYIWSFPMARSILHSARVFTGRCVEALDFSWRLSYIAMVKTKKSGGMQQ